jgi:phage terminase large subunit-like protein
MNSMVRLFTREIDGKTHYYCVAPKFWVPYDTVYSVEKTKTAVPPSAFRNGLSWEY